MGESRLRIGCGGSCRCRGSWGLLWRCGCGICLLLNFLVVMFDLRRGMGSLSRLVLDGRLLCRRGSRALRLCWWWRWILRRRRSGGLILRH